MAYERIHTSLSKGIETITLDYGPTLNALDMVMAGELAEALEEAEGNPEVKVLVLAGAGRAFSAGGDIRAWAGMEANEFGHAWVRFGHRVFERLATLRMPLVAAVNGHALGGGLELAAAADIRIAETQVKIGLPEAGLGMVPGWSGTQRLVKRFGAQAVRRMLLGGEVLTAAEAAMLGIVDQVVETGMAVEAARAYAARITARGPAATEISKLMIAVANGEDNGAAVEALGSILVAKTGDLKEGVAAFSEKRAAHFTGEW